MEPIRYIHETTIHNTKDPDIIVPVILDILKPKSIIDVGCGVGTFLSVFQKYGVSDVLGLDGSWVNKELLARYIKLDNFKEVDLESPINIGRRFDLAICLEVAEHLSESSSDIFVDNLISVSDFILFSAAIPNQGGQNHLNEQWPNYWVEKFTKRGYLFYDVLRPIFWDDHKLARWYKQNIFLVIKKEKSQIVEKIHRFSETNIQNLVHPEFYERRVAELAEYCNWNQKLNKEINEILTGEKSFKFYFKLMFTKLLKIFF
jgi:SAM-dependent methyltransferase